jgi:prepilin-type N-terminal cleavage/methylation domain-containing protein
MIPSVAVPNSSAERGFTLLELMGALAIVATLAAIAVPSFTRSTRKSKAQAEVAAIFAELTSREEQHKITSGAYLSAASCPATTTPTGTSASTCLGTGSAWTTMNVNPGRTTLLCSYQITAGLAAATASVPAGFTFSQPPTSWYYVVATCDGDGSATLNATYFTSSVDSSIQRQDEGE